MAMSDATPPDCPRHGALAAALLLSTLVAACAAPGTPEGTSTASAPPAAASAARAIALTNPGFESDKGVRGGNPEGWAAHQHAGLTAYTFIIDRTTKHSGDASLRIRNLRPEVYGSITQSVPAAPHLGKTLRFSVWLRSESVVGNDFGKGATPLLQAMVGGSPAVSASFEVAAIAGTTEWVRREVVIDVPSAAESIEIGVMLTGSGTVWLDDAVLEAAAPR
jgi:hypothetical protein